MNPNDPFKDLAKRLQKQGGISRRLSSMSPLADISRDVMRSFEPPKNLFQNALDQANRTAAIYRSLNSVGDEIRKRLAATTSLADVSRSMFHSIATHQSAFQKAIESATRTAAIHQNLNAQLAQALDAGKLAKLYAASPFDQLRKSMESVSAFSRMWQSTQIADLASRVVRDADFRSAFIQRLEAQMPTATEIIESPASSEQIIDLVEREIAESGVALPSSDATTSLNQLFSRWSQLPQDLRTFLMMMFVMLLQVALEYSPPPKQQPSIQVVVKQHVKVIQNITNSFFAPQKIPNQELPLFGVITKERLPVFQSNRRDSVRLATLPATQLVIIKNQKRNRILIEWRDLETSEMRSGWVFTRYVKKI